MPKTPSIYVVQTETGRSFLASRALTEDQKPRVAAIMSALGAQPGASEYNQRWFAVAMPPSEPFASTVDFADSVADQHGVPLVEVEQLVPLREIDEYLGQQATHRLFNLALAARV